MALRIIKASDVVTVSQIVMTLYGPPGARKSTLAFTAEAPLLINFDEPNALARVPNRKDAVQITKWGDVTAIDANELKPYRTVIVDTIGRALDVLAIDIMDRDSKMGFAGALSLQGYGRLKAQFTGWLKLLRSLGLDVVLIAHVNEDKKGDDLIERIDAQGASKNEIYKVSDAMGRLAIRNGKLNLLFSPTDTTFGKNPAGMEPLVIPDAIDNNSRILADVIATIKTSMNKQSEEQQHATRLLTEWAEEIKRATTAERLTKLIAVSQALDESVRDTAKKALAAHADNLGFAYNKDAAKFEQKPAAAGVAP